MQVLEGSRRRFKMKTIDDVREWIESLDKSSEEPTDAEMQEAFKIVYGRPYDPDGKDEDDDLFSLIVAGI
jgi:hypothetical protein